MPGRSDSAMRLSDAFWWLSADNAQPAKPVKKVFISYNHADTDAMRAVKAFLEKEKIEVTVDVEKIRTGQSILDFINECLKGNKYVLSIISKNSLLSGWVNKELTAVQLLSTLEKSYWIPARVDNACFDPEFFFSSVAHIDNELKQIQGRINKAFEMAQNPAPFFEEYNRSREHRDNFSTTIDALRKVMVRDISNEQFAQGMTRIAKEIHQS